jgi:glycosyltransferase involved in cell wall biosynthesis
MDRVDFSVVIPVHNSEQSLTELTQKLDSVFIKLGKSYEIIFVNDGSTDNSLITLKTLHAQNNSIKIIDLFRNYGQQNAIMCGFNHCVGNIVLTMDDDLQHDPNDIPKLFDKLQEGFDVVIGVFSTKKHSIIKNMGSACIRALNKRIFKLKDKNLRFTSYRMMRKEVIDQIKDETTNYPYISGLLVATTNRIANVNVSHNERLYGKSSYKLSSLVSLSYNLIVNYSSIPLKLIGYIGLIVSLFSMCFGSYFVIKKLLIGTIPAGITTIIVLISFYNALIFVFLFFLSEYVSRILKESSQKKQYVIREVIK